MTPAELREHLKKPPVPGKMEEFLRSVRGLMSEEEGTTLNDESMR